MNPSKMPSALLPPPTQATIASGKRPVWSRNCRRASLPMTDWNSRTIRGYGCGPSAGPQQIVRVSHAGDPVTHRLINGVLQCAAPSVDVPHGGAKYFHAKDVQCLAPDVLDSHVHVTLESEQRAGRCRRDAMLSCARLGEHPPLPHPDGQQRLTESVVDLVGACVGEILTLQEMRAPRISAESRRASYTGVGRRRSR